MSRTHVDNSKITMEDFVVELKSTNNNSDGFIKIGIFITIFTSPEQTCKFFSALGYKGQVWKGNPFGLLYLRLPDEPDSDDVTDHCWDCSSQQVKTLQSQLDISLSLSQLQLIIISQFGCRPQP